MSDRPQKITFRDMRESGVRGVCSDYRCSHHIAISGIGGPMMFACLILSRPVRLQRMWQARR
jgi:hypothetical protein